MTRKELIEAVAREASRQRCNRVSAALAADIISVALETIANELSAGGSIRLVELGNFTTHDKPERTARNPATGETIVVKAHKVVKFTPAGAVVDALKWRK